MEENNKGLNETIKLHIEELDKYVKNFKHSQDAICNILNTLTAIVSFNKFNLSSNDIDSLCKQVRNNILDKFTELCIYLNDDRQGYRNAYRIFNDVCDNAITVSKEWEEEKKQLYLQQWPTD